MSNAPAELFAHAPEWPVCGNCREWHAGACRYAPASAHRWRLKPAGGAANAACGYWHSPAGETRRDRCRAVNAALQKTRPPVPARRKGAA